MLPNFLIIGAASSTVGPHDPPVRDDQQNQQHWPDPSDGKGHRESGLVPSLERHVEEIARPDTQGSGSLVPWTRTCCS